MLNTSAKSSIHTYYEVYKKNTYYAKHTKD